MEIKVGAIYFDTYKKVEIKAIFDDQVTIFKVDSKSYDDDRYETMSIGVFKESFTDDLKAKLIEDLQQRIDSVKESIEHRQKVLGTLMEDMERLKAG